MRHWLMGRMMLAVVAGMLMVTGSAAAAPGHEDSGKKQASKQAQRQSVYPLSECAHCGRDLSEAKKPVTVDEEGRKLTFCGAGCASDHRKNPEATQKRVDQRLAEQQRPYYPLETCIVMTEEPLGEGPREVIHGDRLVQLCCSKCEREFTANPEEYLKKLDQAVVEQQQADYPLTTCVVSGEELGSMGESRNVVVQNRLVRLCCPMCEGKLRAKPAEYLTQIDAARAEQAGEAGEKHAHAEHGKAEGEKKSGHACESCSAEGGEACESCATHGQKHDKGKDKGKGDHAGHGHEHCGHAH